MDFNVKKEQAAQWMHGVLEKLGSFKYAGLILLLGIGLMLLPTGSEEKETEKLPVQDQSGEQLEERLEDLLSQVEGAGKVKVLLTLETGTVNTYQEDTKTTSSADDQESQTETVLVSSGGDEVPIPVKTTYPTYKGAVVVCQGADRASVKLALIQAVSSLTGLGSDHITVIKMKSD